MSDEKRMGEIRSLMAEKELQARYRVDLWWEVRDLEDPDLKSAMLERLEKEYDMVECPVCCDRGGTGEADCPLFDTGCESGVMRYRDRESWNALVEQHGKSQAFWLWFGYEEE